MSPLQCFEHCMQQSEDKGHEASQSFRNTPPAFTFSDFADARGLVPHVSHAHIKGVSCVYTLLRMESLNKAHQILGLSTFILQTHNIL